MKEQNESAPVAPTPRKFEWGDELNEDKVNNALCDLYNSCARLRGQELACGNCLLCKSRLLILDLGVERRKYVK